MEQSGRWIIVSNRLPVSYDREKNKFKPSSGGLVSALANISYKAPRLWVGTFPGKKRVAPPEDLVPIYLDDELYADYYAGMANDVFWPLFHYETGLVRFDWSNWEAYVKVNRVFAGKIKKLLKPGDLVWVHDYHLFLLPQFLKEKNPNAKVGFFLHIPFPSSEVFRALPVREEILRGLLSSDLIGFHDYSYLRHFVSAVHNTLGIESSLLKLQAEGYNTDFGVFPVSINTQKFLRSREQTEVKKEYTRLKKEKNHSYVILGVDRLDYIKGIELKLKAFRHMLRTNPDLAGEVSLIQIAVPSRVDVPEYQATKNEIDRLVGEINGEFGRPYFQPVRYIFNSVDFSTLVALYQIADVLFVTSKRDGMNLVALEYIASQRDASPGVVLLSEFAGAISNLSDVVPINPWNIRDTALKLRQALEMPLAERKARHSSMVGYLKRYNSTEWARSFLSKLAQAGRVHQHQAAEMHAPRNHVQIPEEILSYLAGTPAGRKVKAARAGEGAAGNKQNYPEQEKEKEQDKVAGTGSGLQHASSSVPRRPRLVLLTDYDGTLTPIVDRPEDAVLPAAMRSILKEIRAKDLADIFVVSGRSGAFLEEQLKGLDVGLVSEHGARVKEPGAKKWTILSHSPRQAWFPTALQIMKDITARVAGSFIERKTFAITWHYRLSPPDFAQYQARKLIEELEAALLNQPVAVLSGKKVVEVRAVEANKGAFYTWLANDLRNRGILEQHRFIAIGDDETDEDLFQAMDRGYSIRVGNPNTKAQFYLAEQNLVEPFFRNLFKIKKTAKRSK